jgi:peptidoglycan/xylan/chitin deacetylase (PgdA/CDA1 family)
MRPADGIRVRKLVKTGLARALFWTRTDALFGALADPTRTPVVLGYHRVVEDFHTEARETIAAMLITPRMLEQQLDWIGQRFRFVGLDELGERLEQGGEAVGRMAAVTFDDGYRDVYEHAFPLLQRKGIPSAAFVVTDLVGRRELLGHDRLYLALKRAFARWSNPAGALRRLLNDLRIWMPGTERWTGVGWTAGSVMVWLLRSLSQGEIRRIVDVVEGIVGVDEAAARSLLPMTWDMLARMQRAGVVIGSHTKSHAWLTLEDRAYALDELYGSRVALEARLGVTVRHFAYPDGQFNKEMAALVAVAGYRFGYTTCSHRDSSQPLLTIPRRMLWQNACLDGRGRFCAAILSCHVHGVFGLMRGCEQDHAASGAAATVRTFPDPAHTGEASGGDGTASS